MFQEKAGFQLMLTELNAFGVPFFLPPHDKDLGWQKSQAKIPLL